MHPVICTTDMMPWTGERKHNMMIVIFTYASKSHCNRALNQKNGMEQSLTQSKFDKDFLLFNCGKEHPLLRRQRTEWVIETVSMQWRTKLYTFINFQISCKKWVCWKRFNKNNSKSKILADSHSCFVFWGSCIHISGCTECSKYKETSHRSADWQHTRQRYARSCIQNYY
jgi:hypothetical protein